MGITKLRWTTEEEAALIAGVQKHGAGKWKNILTDPDFATLLFHRSNIDLKDKWRNMTISSSGQGPREYKTRALRATPIQSVAPVSQNSPAPAPAPLTLEDVAVDDRSKSLQEERNVTNPSYNSMILEAITSMNAPNGSDLGDILHYIQQQHRVPHKFRRVLSCKLRRLVLQGRLEKIENRFKIKDESGGSQPSLLKEKDKNGHQGPSETIDSVTESLQATLLVAEAENKSIVLAEAVAEFQRITKLVEDAESVIELVKYMHDKCSRGQTILV